MEDQQRTVSFSSGRKRIFFSDLFVQSMYVVNDKKDDTGAVHVFGFFNSKISYDKWWSLLLGWVHYCFDIH